MNANINVDTTTELAIVNLLASLFDGTAILDADTVRDNIELACEGGFKLEDRQIRFGLANYLMNNFGVIYAGLVLDSDFRYSFMDAVSVEMQMDGLDPEFVRKAREQTRDPKEGTSGVFTFDFTKFSNDMYNRTVQMITDSFDKIDGFSDMILAAKDGLDDDAMIDIGYVASNFMYLLRAFSKNVLFTDYVKSVVHSVNEGLKNVA